MVRVNHKRRLKYIHFPAIYTYLVTKVAAGSKFNKSTPQFELDLRAKCDVADDWTPLFTTALYDLHSKT
jgi:hypothetical protein